MLDVGLRDPDRRRALRRGVADELHQSPDMQRREVNVEQRLTLEQIVDAVLGGDRTELLVVDQARDMSPHRVGFSPCLSAASLHVWFKGRTRRPFRTAGKAFGVRLTLRAFECHMRMAVFDVERIRMQRGILAAAAGFVHGN